MKRASSDLLLPDVNVLLAIAWPNHLRLAAVNNAVLVTFDRRLESVAEGTPRLKVLG